MSDSLINALKEARIPGENHAFIRSIINAVGVSELTFDGSTDKPYVLATRRDGGRPLRIYYGYTTGFDSKEEVVALLGDTASPTHSKAGWWVPHPENRIYDGSERARGRRKEAGFCDCGLQLSLTGACLSCE